MYRSDKHEDARIQACRVPALQASLDLLVERGEKAKLLLFDGTQPAAGEGGTTPIVTIELSSGVGSVNEALRQINLDIPVEGSAITNSPVTLTWCRITDGDGDWWGDFSVSESGGGGEIIVTKTLVDDGDVCRLVKATFQG